MSYMSFTDNEPLITGAGLTSIAAAIIALLVAFGVPLTDQQREAILGLIGLVGPIAVILLVRSHVTPTAKINPS